MYMYMYMHMYNVHVCTAEEVSLVDGTSISQ